MHFKKSFKCPKLPQTAWGNFGHFWIKIVANLRGLYRNLLLSIIHLHHNVIHSENQLYCISGVKVIAANIVKSVRSYPG